MYLLNKKKTFTTSLKFNLNDIQDNFKFLE